MTSQEQFIKLLAPYVQQEFIYRYEKGEKTVLPSVCIAQACLESGYNIQSESLFGIKGNGKLSHTTEEINGELIDTMCEFVKYDSVQSAVIGYYDLMQWDNYNDVTSAKTFYEQIDGLTNDNGYKYATDSNYKNKLLNIINDYNLTEYDKIDNFKVENHIEFTDCVLKYLANGVINGDFGNGEERKKNLGILYNDVQNLVNKMV